MSSHLATPSRWIRTALRLGFTAFGIAGGTLAAAELRVWTPADGGPIEAEFLTIRNQQVMLLRASDNSRLSYRLDQLAAADREWIEGRAASRSEPLDPAQIAALVRIPDDADGLIRLPLRVHLVNGIEMKKDGVSMRTWITPREVEQTVLPEINRIWEPAGIQWVIESVIDRPVEEIPNQREAITFVQNSSREAAGKDGPKRVPTIHALSGKKDQHPVVHNLFLFPFVGSTFQGFAEMGGNSAFLGVWTNKPSQGKKPPQRCLLVEKEPMEMGSIGRTAGHELGHNLGLEHPDRKTQTEFKRLMGGIEHGYRLLPEEIKPARIKALERAKKILSSVPDR